MRRYLALLILLAGSVATGQIPQELVGKWIIQWELPTKTISCWGDEDAKAIIGSEIEYTPDSFRWKTTVVKHPAVEVRVVSAEQFEHENSSASVNGSQVSFRQLGINAPDAKQVSINHPPAEITKATTEIPGDEVLLKNNSTLIFSVCSLYFEATRVRRQTGRAKYPLTEFDNYGCTAKGRVQDCSGNVMQQILADGKDAIAILISQLTDTAIARNQIADYWSGARSGDVAFVVLTDLFTDADLHTFGMPGVPDWGIVQKGCNKAAQACWNEYLRKHGRMSVRQAWQRAWTLHKDKIHWDAKTQCFRISND